MVRDGFLRVNTEKYMVLSMVTPTLRWEETLLLLNCSVNPCHCNFGEARLAVCFSRFPSAITIDMFFG